VLLEEPDINFGGLQENMVDADLKFKQIKGGKTMIYPISN
jgi:hypothetical protein